MSKIYERRIHNSLSSYAEIILSNFISVYKKSYSSNHVFLRLIENWEKSRDNNNFMGTVLTNLSKAFDCIPNNLIAAKFHAYGLLEDAVTLCIHIKQGLCIRRKQDVKINDTDSVFQILLSGTPQSSILSPILFKTLINYFIFFIKDV